MESKEPGVAKWKFWYPLSIWKVLGIFLVTSLVFQVAFALLREGLGLGFAGPGAAGGATGFVGVAIVSALARAQRNTSTA